MPRVRPLSGTPATAVTMLTVAALTLAVAACSGPARTGPGDPSPVAGPASAHLPAESPVPSRSGSPSASPSSRPSTKPGSSGSCAILPADNVWHADVSRLPVHSKSSAYVASIGKSANVHADFGSGTWDGAPIGIPITTVGAGQAKVSVTFTYKSESDRGGYPIPANAAIEGGRSSDGDRHIIVIDTAACRDYELYAAYPKGSGWTAGSGAIYDLNGNGLRPAGWTSADAAGLPILPGLVTYKEVASGHIDHAIRVTVPRSQAKYLWPARHFASDSNDTSLPPMGLRLRLKASFDVSHLPSQARVIATAMKKYGVIVADNGSPWYISGAPDAHWNNDQLHALDKIVGTDFEAIDESGLQRSTNSGQVK